MLYCIATQINSNFVYNHCCWKLGVKCAFHTGPQANWIQWYRWYMSTCLLDTCSGYHKCTVHYNSNAISLFIRCDCELRYLRSNFKNVQLWGAKQLISPFQFSSIIIGNSGHRMSFMCLRNISHANSLIGSTELGDNCSLCLVFVCFSWGTLDFIFGVLGRYPIYGIAYFDKKRIPNNSYGMPNFMNDSLRIEETHSR